MTFNFFYYIIIHRALKNANAIKVFLFSIILNTFCDKNVKKFQNALKKVVEKTKTCLSILLDVYLSVYLSKLVTKNKVHSYVSVINVLNI